MMTRPQQVDGTRFQNYGLSAFTFHRRAVVGHMDDLRLDPAHTHLELEIHFVETGAITLDCGGREETLEPGELLAFWGGIPHRDVDPQPPVTIYHVAQVPIVNVLTWVGSAPVLDRLLSGELLKTTVTASDAVAVQLSFARWVSDLGSGDPQLRLAVEMEIQAQLLRLLRQAGSTPSVLMQHVGAATANGVAQAIHYVTRHFVEEITIDDIARRVDWHRDYLMTSFRRVCGLTLWEYVTRLRLSEAQRLLLGTDLPILAVCHRTGFSSTSRMYEAFHRYLGQTPATYRQLMNR